MVYHKYMLQLKILRIDLQKIGCIFYQFFFHVAKDDCNCVFGYEL